MDLATSSIELELDLVMVCGEEDPLQQSQEEGLSSATCISEIV